MAGPCAEYGYDVVGEGWKSILEALDKKFIETMGSNLPILKIYQIKEKFGGLRVYIGIEDFDDIMQTVEPKVLSELYTAIDNAETLCIKTCENCGSTKEVKTRARGDQKRGWVKTYCAECHSKNDEGADL